MQAEEPIQFADSIGAACKLHKSFALLRMTNLRIGMIAIEQSKASVTFAVKVHPRARKNAVTGEVGDALKLSLTTPPVEGRANEACIGFFAKLLKVPRSSDTIAAGQTSRNKVIRVAGVTAAYVAERLQG